MGRRIWVGVSKLAAAAVLVASMAVGSNAAPASAVLANGSSAYTAVTPTRILDSRIAIGVPGRLGGQSSFVLDIGGIAPVPANASAVVFNLTATNAGGAG